MTESTIRHRHPHFSSNGPLPLRLRMSQTLDVSQFLGIQFVWNGATIKLTQKGLIDKIIATAGMENCNSAKELAKERPLGRDLHGVAFNEDWNYASVISMLLYVASNSRPDIAFAVHQCARFTHNLKQLHAVTVKRIIRYLSRTKGKGLVMQPDQEMKLDCYIDADFAGLWGVKDLNDSICVRSHTGYIITLAGCPLLWVSKLQMLTSTSTMQAEYVALSTAMRDLIPLCRVLKLVSISLLGSKTI